MPTKDLLIIGPEEAERDKICHEISQALALGKGKKGLEEVIQSSPDPEYAKKNFTLLGFKIKSNKEGIIIKRFPREYQQKKQRQKF